MPDIRHEESLEEAAIPELPEPVALSTFDTVGLEDGKLVRKSDGRVRTQYREDDE